MQRSRSSNRPIPARNQPAEPGTPGRVGWHELLAADRERALAFYSELFGWQKADAMDMGAMGTYQLFPAGGQTIDGMFTEPPMVPTPYWLYYFNVGDIDAAVERVKTGGDNGPMEVPGGGWIIQGKDPKRPCSRCSGSGNSPPRKRTTAQGTRVHGAHGRPPLLQLGDTCPGAVFVLLRGTATDAAGALDDAVTHDRDCPLAHDHVVALRSGNAARGRLVGPLGHLAARTTKRCGRDGLPLAAIGTRPYGIVHALQRDQTAAAIADRGTDLDVELLCFRQGTPNDAVGFFQR